MTLGEKLPSGWAWAPLGDLLTGIDSGKSFKCEERPPLANEIGVVKVSAVSWGEYRERESKTCVDSHRVEPAYFIRPGDFLVSRANTIELVGAAVIVRRVTQPVMLSDKILRLHFAEDALKPWVLQYLRSAAGRQQIEQLASGNQESMRNIGQDRLKQIQVPLPPNLQRITISSKLDELVSDLAAAEVELSAARRKLALYRQALLKSAVEGALTADWRLSNAEVSQPAVHGVAPCWLPKGWGWMPVSALPELSMANGRSVPTATTGAKVLRLTAIREGGVDLTQFKVGAWSSDEAAPFAVREGDLLVVRGNGSLSLVGRAGVVGKVTQDIAYPDTLIRLRWAHDFILPAWMTSVWDSALVRDHMERKARTSAGIYKISQPDIASAFVPVPSPLEQMEIVRRMQESAVNMAAVGASLVAVERSCSAQRQNILRAAFSGQLVPQDPNDEPASVMLERIRASKSSAAPAKTKTKARGRVKAAAA